VIEVEGAHRLSPAEREVLRLRVVAALESGRVEGYRWAAEAFGVSERSVGTSGLPAGRFATAWRLARGVPALPN